MRAIEFKEQNAVLGKPEGMTDEGTDKRKNYMSQLKLIE